MVIHTKKNNEADFKGISLCTGLGGLELGIELAEPSYRTICYIEREGYCAATLVERMEKQELHTAPVWSDVTTFDGKPWSGKVDIITGGYPCQPFSASGKRKAGKDPRHLWPDIQRIIGEVQPRYCFFENVQGHLDRGFEEVARDLVELGFVVKAGLFSAAEVGASHQRSRLFILADANGLKQRELSRNPSEERENELHKRRFPIQPQLSGNSLDQSVGIDQEYGVQIYREKPAFPPCPNDFELWEKNETSPLYPKPAILRSNDGLAYRVERYHAAGNGVVPLQAAYAWRTLKDA